MLTEDLFQQVIDNPKHRRLGEGTLLLQDFITAEAPQLIDEITNIIKVAPFRNMVTATGLKMSVAMTNCGDLGWVPDQKGYRYTQIDPLTGNIWPAMPKLFLKFACSAAKLAGFVNFNPNACLINRYNIGTKLSIHQDKDENNMQAPIVSCSLGLPAIFLWGGLTKSDKATKLSLRHGDVLVWGGVDRLRFHGVMPIDKGSHPLLGEQRINITFRQVS